MTTALKKSLPYILTSLAVIGLWRLFTLRDNYAWFPKGKEPLMLDIALSTVFIYKTVFWLIIANMSVFIVKSLLKIRYKAAGIAALIGGTFYLAAGQVVDKKCAFSYYMIFVNQSVSEEYLQDPIKQAGYHIGPILTDKIKDKNLRYRRYAIGGLGEINYKPATETLRTILFDKTEHEEFRADAYETLTKFRTDIAKKIVDEFRASADTSDQKIVDLGNYFLQN